MGTTVSKITAVKHKSTACIPTKPAGLDNINTLLPVDFLQWQSEARIEVFSRLKTHGASAVKTQPAHLPVLATAGTGAFPANMTTKGVGLVPRSDLLEHFTTLFIETRDKASAQSSPETLSSRVEAAQSFYSAITNFDASLLGGLEIFDGRTAQNARKNPRASLLYTGKAPRYPSYQFNVIISIIDADNPYYRFLRAARELFAFDSFHIPQIRYPFGYLFHVVEVLDKTPYPQR